VQILFFVLMLLTLAGAADEAWRSPVLMALPVLCLLGWIMAAKIARQGKKIRELEVLLAKGSRAETYSSGPVRTMDSASRSRSPVVLPDVSASADDAMAPGRSEYPEEFDFSEDQEPAVAPPPPTWTRPNATVQDRPSWISSLWGQLWSWIGGGNPVVKAGIVVLFFGVSFLLKYANDHSLLPVEYRMAGAGTLGLVLLGLGWKLRDSKRLYALLVQGGGIGVLYLTVFAAARFFGLLPVLAAFCILVAIVVFSTILAILQDAVMLALFGFAGGFLAPVLLSTGQGSHVHLFAYYALLNVGVLGVAWFRTWRVLNLLGFVFTFGIGAAWGANFYKPEFFATVEPFLVLYFLMYAGISILFARANQMGSRIRLDSALVFGLPLVTFGLQSALVRELEMGAAYSSLALAAWYLLPIKLIWNKDGGLRILAEAHLALGIIFVSLAVPLALDASWTSSTWALEGAGMIWLGLRQQRLITRIFGLLLQLGGALACVYSVQSVHPETLINGHLFAGLFLAVGGLCSSWSYFQYTADQRSWEKYAVIALGVWGGVWWYGTWFDQITRHVVGNDFPALLGVAVGSLLVWLMCALKSRWSIARYLVPISALLLLVLAVRWPSHPGHLYGWAAWPLALLTLYAAFFLLEKRQSLVLSGVAHGLGLLVVATLGLMEIHWQILQAVTQQTWAMGGLVMAGSFVILLVAMPPNLLAWPVRGHHGAYLQGAALIAFGLVAWWFGACTIPGDPAPLPYVPILNPFDLVQAWILCALAIWFREFGVFFGDRQRGFGNVLQIGLSVGVFIWLNIVVARVVHFMGGVPYNPWDMFGSAVLQSAYSVLWSLAALVAMLEGWRRSRRRMWLSGAVLMAVVVGKLFLVDLDGRGTVARIVSFLGVGLLMLVVGYFCPLPPKEEKA